jgi:pyruvate formate lyase activating enzyme
MLDLLIFLFHFFRFLFFIHSFNHSLIPSMGIVFDIKRFAVHDGPGIRTTVFFKGCPLRCIWCHNPESFELQPFCSPKNERMGTRTFVREEWIGKPYAVIELLEVLMRDQIFWDESGGGVTLSGGEPFMQFGFMNELIENLNRKGVHVAVDTTGHTRSDYIAEVANGVHLFLYDIKTLDDNLHRATTGVSNRLILKNLDLLLDRRAKVRIRIPVITGINFNAANRDSFVHYLSERKDGIAGVDLLPFHAIAFGKYERFHLENKMKGVPSLKVAELTDWKDAFENAGLKTTLGG